MTDPQPTELVITNDDGFETRWPWPSDHLMISNAAFVDICCDIHDTQRRAAGLEVEA